MEKVNNSDGTQPQVKSSTGSDTDSADLKTPISPVSPKVHKSEREITLEKELENLKAQNNQFSLELNALKQQQLQDEKNRESEIQKMTAEISEDNDELKSGSKIDDDEIQEINQLNQKINELTEFQNQYKAKEQTQILKAKGFTDAHINSIVEKFGMNALISGKATAFLTENFTIPKENSTAAPSNNIDAVPTAKAPMTSSNFSETEQDKQAKMDKIVKTILTNIEKASLTYSS